MGNGRLISVLMFFFSAWFDSATFFFTFSSPPSPRIVFVPSSAENLCKHRLAYSDYKQQLEGERAGRAGEMGWGGGVKGSIYPNH